MGNLDSIILADADLPFDDYGEAATYIPADDEVSPFSATVVISRVRVNEFAGMAYADKTECRIRHADLALGGLTLPTVHHGNTRGDTITATDPRGSIESWQIVAARLERKTQCWVLDIEKDYRFRP